MKTSTFLLVYGAAVLGCLFLTAGIIKLIIKGLAKYLDNLVQDNEISKFFVRLIVLILLLGGMSAALDNSYEVDKSNWLTLSWDAVDQVQGTMTNLFSVLITFSILFLIIELVRRRFTR